MSEVKRYTVRLPSPDGYTITPWTTKFNRPTKIVLASDYDALAAENERLRETFRQIKEMAVVKTDSGRNAVTIWLIHNAAHAAIAKEPTT